MDKQLGKKKKKKDDKYKRRVPELWAHLAPWHTDHLGALSAETILTHLFVSQEILDKWETAGLLGNIIKCTLHLKCDKYRGL